jgi:hypothetical protein
MRILYGHSDRIDLVNPPCWWFLARVLPVLSKLFVQFVLLISTL